MRCTIHSSTNQTLRRCFLVWLRSSTNAADRGRVEAGYVCFALAERNRTMLRADRKKDTSDHLSYEKFSDYILKKEIMIQTDNKPLIPLLITKQLDSLPPRVLRFHLRTNRFTYILHHVLGKNLHKADTLSRALLISMVNDKDLEELVELLMVANISYLPSGEKWLQMHRQAQKIQPSTYCDSIAKWLA